MTKTLQTMQGFSIAIAIFLFSYPDSSPDTS